MLKSILIILGLILVVGVWAQTRKEEAKQEEITQITVGDVRKVLEDEKDVLLLDVRTAVEYDGPLGHIDGSLLIPVQELELRIKELEPFRDKDIIVYCRSGKRSVTATNILVKGGFRAINMVGGMKAWNVVPK